MAKKKGLKSPPGLGLAPTHQLPAPWQQETVKWDPHLNPDAPGAAPAPPPDASVAPQPFDPQYEAYKLGAQWNTSLAQGEAGYQRGQTAYESGYDASGARFSANPYAQAQQLEDSYRRSQTGTNNSMFAAGQGYSGARLNAQARNDRGYSQSSDALKRGTADRFHQIGYGQLQAYGANAAGVGGADYDALRRATYG